MKKVTSTEGNNLVALDNRIVENLCPLSLNEKRLVYLLLGRVKNSYKEGLSMEEVLSKEVTPEEVKAGRWVVGETLSPEGWYSITVRDFAEATGVRLDNARNELEEVAESLRTKAVYINFGEDVGYVKVNWVSSIRFDVKGDCIGVRWNSDIIPLVCNLTEYFVKLRLKEVLLLRSTYSWKLHEVLVMLRGVQDYRKDVVVGVEDLKKMLGVPKGLQEYKYFKGKILNMAVKELNEKGVRKGLEFREVKEGRWVRKLVWSWK